MIQMGESRGEKGVVVAIRPRHRAQGRCSCGWVGPPRMLLSSAKVDALIHTAHGDCEAAIPVVQPESIDAPKPPGVLTVACPAGCEAALAIPIAIGDMLSVGIENGEPCTRFTAEAPELHHIVCDHLRVCPSAHDWVDAALYGTTTATAERPAG
jgi:hypothetical protein